MVLRPPIPNSVVGECFYESRVTSVECICENCGTSFIVIQSVLNKGNGKFCSMDCRSIAFTGDGNPSYKGGGFDKKGYCIIQIKGKQYQQHRLIMEKHLNRKLTKDECTHHINGIVNDNDINNLQLMTNSEHCSHHHKLRRQL